MIDTRYAIRLNGVTKRFGNHAAVSELNFDVPRGAICGLLGPNGSGKTTCIRMIMGILHPDTGSVSLLGATPDDVRRKRVGYLPEERGVYRKMTCTEFLTFLAEIRGYLAPKAGNDQMIGLNDWDLMNGLIEGSRLFQKGCSKKSSLSGQLFMSLSY